MNNHLINWFNSTHIFTVNFVYDLKIIQKYLFCMNLTFNLQIPMTMFHFSGDLLLWDLAMTGQQKWQPFSSSDKRQQHNRMG
jgi:hypothetical protein